MRLSTLIHFPSFSLYTVSREGFTSAGISELKITLIRPSSLLQAPRFLVVRHPRASTGLAFGKSCLQMERRWMRDMYVWQSSGRSDGSSCMMNRTSFSTFAIAIVREISFQQTQSAGVRHGLISTVPDLRPVRAFQRECASNFVEEPKHTFDSIDASTSPNDPGPCTCLWQAQFCIQRG